MSVECVGSSKERLLIGVNPSNALECVGYSKEKVAHWSESKLCLGMCRIYSKEKVAHVELPTE